MLITGAGMGIGKEMVHQFSSLGCVVVMWDIRKDLIDALAAEINMTSISNQPRVFAVQCDVSSRESVNAAAKLTLANVPQVDVIINNAGIVSGKLFSELTTTNIQRTMGVNFFGGCFTLQEFLPAMLSRKSGHVVTVSSVMGILPGAGLTDYCASKFAVVGFARSLRLELKKLSGGTVKSTLICPFAINTGMFHGIKTNFQWLFPILEPRDVAQRIVEAVQYEEEIVVMPALLGLVARIMPILPLCLQDFIGEQCGAMDGMDSFVGRHENANSK